MKGIFKFSLLICISISSLASAQEIACIMLAPYSASLTSDGRFAINYSSDAGNFSNYKETKKDDFCTGGYVTNAMISACSNFLNSEGLSCSLEEEASNSEAINLDNYVDKASYLKLLEENRKLRRKLKKLQ